MHDAATEQLPRNGAARKKLQEKGQFWTPDWIADAMVAWAANGADHIFDPAVGPGAFFRAGKRFFDRKQIHGRLIGCELDRAVLESSLAQGLDTDDVKSVTVGDFMCGSYQRRFKAIVANPPYLRHHRFTAEYKTTLRIFSSRTTGQDIDGRAGLHVFFLIKALTLLEKGGRLAFIVSSDICEGRFASGLWKWIKHNFCIEGAVTFSPDATPFPGVDTNAILLLISNNIPARTVRWARVSQHNLPYLLSWCEADLPMIASPGFELIGRDLDESVRTGLTRKPANDSIDDSVLFGQLFRAVRGIATGANEFFFMTHTQLTEKGLPESAFLRAIGRTRDITGSTIQASHLQKLDRQGRPTYLLSLGRMPTEAFSPVVQSYLRQGVAQGLPDRPLISQRKPWYRMETRVPPPWLFAYLGRRDCRFIRNEAHALPLTGFLCIYLQPEIERDLVAATKVLNDPRTIANLYRVGKSYGGGALKVEPRSLEKLPIPKAVLEEHGLRVPYSTNMLSSLAEDP